MLSTVWARTKGIPAFEVPLDKETQEFTVSKDFMASTYGGSMQATCPTISKRRLAQHGKDNFTYLHLDYHQEAPEVAGSPRLFFNSSSGPDWPGLQRVFTRITSNKWQFMGMYEIKSCASLTKEEWKCSKERVCLIRLSDEMLCAEETTQVRNIRMSAPVCVDVLT